MSDDYFFSSNRFGSLGAHDIWTAERGDTGSAFSSAVNLFRNVNSYETDRDVTLTADGRELFFSSDRTGNFEIWQSIRSCQVVAQTGN